MSMVEPTQVWCDQCHNAAKGATGGTYDNIGNITVKSPAEEGKWHKILAILVNTTLTLPTSGQNGVPILRVRSDDLGITNQDIPLQAYTDGIATNDKEAPIKSILIPFFVDPSRSTRNAKVYFDITSNVDMTGGHDIAVGLMYGNEQPTVGSSFYMELMAAAGLRPAQYFVKAESDAGISAASLTAFTDLLSKTSQAKLLTAISGIVNPNAPTAGEAVSGYMQLAASQIQDFSPQNWPLNLAYSASLGTPVGTLVNANVPFWPTRFVVPETTFDITPSMDLVVALTNAGDGVAALKLR